MVKTVSVSLWSHPILKQMLSFIFRHLMAWLVYLDLFMSMESNKKTCFFYQAKENHVHVHSKLACSLFSRLTCFLQSMLLNFVVFICSIFINTVCTYIYHTGQLGLGPCHLNRVGHCFHAKIFGPTHVVISVQVLWSYIWIWDQIQQILIVIWA